MIDEIKSAFARAKDKGSEKEIKFDEYRYPLCPNCEGRTVFRGHTYKPSKNDPKKIEEFKTFHCLKCKKDVRLPIKKIGGR